jgi:hypothetical protein
MGESDNPRRCPIRLASPRDAAPKKRFLEIVSREASTRDLVDTSRKHSTHQHNTRELLYASLAPSNTHNTHPPQTTMVELVEVEDESFESKQVGPSDDEEYTDTGMHTHTPYTQSTTLQHQLTLPLL